MLAIHKSAGPSDTPLPQATPSRFPTVRAILGLTLVSLTSANPTPPNTTVPLAYAQRVYQQTREQYQRSPTNPTNAWHFARACFDLAELPESNPQRKNLAQEGIDACKLAITHRPNLAPAHYYLAMNLGQLARSKPLSALSMIGDMKDAFQTAIRLEPGFHYAGPHRNLGTLYRDAPRWPTSIGNRKKARQHLETALQLSPEFPANHLTYLESLLEWGENDLARKKLPAAQTALQEARSKFTGDQWAFSWEEWDQGWKTIQAKLDR